VGRTSLGESAKADRDWEAGENAENVLDESDTRVVLRGLAIEEPIVDVGVREHELKDDCYQDQGVRQLYYVRVC